MKRFLLSVGAVFALLMSGTLTTHAADVWELVTDASTLQVGDQLVIACTDEEVTAGDIPSGAKYLSSVSSTVSGSTITSLGSGTIVFTLGGKTGAWTLANTDGKLLGCTAEKKVVWGSGTTTWTISIDSYGDATIAITSGSYGSLQYNAQAPRFTTYTSTQTAPQLYRLANNTYTFMYEGYAGYTTRCEGGKVYQEGEVITLSTGVPTKTGYSFAGWQYNNKVYQPGDSFTMPAENVTMMPQWNQSTATDANNALIKTNVQKVIRDGYLYIVVEDKTYNVLGCEL